MQRVHERVSHTYFELAAPRPFPVDALPDLILDYLVRPGLRLLLDPMVFAGLIGVLLFPILKLPWWWLACLCVIVLLWVRGKIMRVIQRIRDEIALLQHGLIVRAHVLRFRPHRTLMGEIDGARIDCAIAVAPRRTYIGSIWLSDGAEAVQIAESRRLLVICLPRTPGTWRVVEDLRSEVRYDRMGPIQRIPTDV
jgi:hypothetical protein